MKVSTRKWHLAMLTQLVKLLLSWQALSVVVKASPSIRDQTNQYSTIIQNYYNEITEKENEITDDAFEGYESEKEAVLGEPDKSINIVEDDIATDLEENLFRISLRWDLYPTKRWINNTVYYQIRTEDYGNREILIIESALKTFQFLTCLQFVPWDGDVDKDYLHILNSKERPGCWSYIGRRGGAQPLSLRPPDSKSCHCLCNVGRILHEMMHALGFYHEHTRPDRDRYIKIEEENVKKGKLKNFSMKTYDTTTVDFDYDYASIMHYGPLFFSKDKKGKKTTIVPLLNQNGNAGKIGQRNMLSKVDCMKLNHVFGCFDPTNDWQNKKIQALCGVLGY